MYTISGQGLHLVIWNDPTRIEWGVYDASEARVSDSQYGGVLMQYTGAKDQSGREVYEGDIVRYVDGRTGREVVAWVEWTKGMFRIHGPLGWTGFNINEDTVRFEVIGNLYENHDTQFMQ